MKNALSFLFCLSLMLPFVGSSQSSLGMQFGALRMKGDIPTEAQLFNQIGFSFQKDLTSKTKISLILNHGRTSGFDYTAWTHVDKGGGLQGEQFEFLTEGRKWYPNYVFRNTGLKLNLEYSPFASEQPTFRKRVLPYFYGGIGFSYHLTNVDLLDENKQHYQIFEEDRVLSVKQIREQYDHTFETSLDQSNGLSPSATFGIGLNYQVSEIWQVLLSGELSSFFSDNLDGITLEQDGLPSNNQDILYLYQFEIRRIF